MRATSQSEELFFKSVRTMGVVLFVACLPMDFLNGHGRGFLADHDHFQGYETLAFLPLLGFSLLRSPSDWPAAFYLGLIGLSNLVVGVGPFIDWRKIPTGAAMALMIATLLTIWGVCNWSIELGMMPGCAVWLIASACGLLWLFRGQAARWSSRDETESSSGNDDSQASPTRKQ